MNQFRHPNVLSMIGLVLQNDPAPLVVCHIDESGIHVMIIPCSDC